MKTNIKVLLREQFEQLTEVDWEGDFKDVKETCINPNELVKYLNQLRDNATSKDKTKFDKGKPFIHAKSPLIHTPDEYRKGVDSKWEAEPSEEGINVEHFIKQITAKPNTVINSLDKMDKTGSHLDFVYKTGIPAFRGIIYDIENDKFHIINTCPGAGSCALICYALKGNYIRFSNSYDSMTRRLNYLMNYPDKYEQQLYDELKAKAIEHDALKGYKNRVILRWNDSGDFFSEKYLNIANSVMSRLQKDGYNVESYAYTKTADNLDKAEFETTFSDDANKEQTKKGKDAKKKAIIVPKQLIKRLNLNKISDEAEAKKIISNHYKVPLDTVLSYDDIKYRPEGNERIWNVIVTNKDGDDAAYRKDVKRIFLIEH